MQIRTNFLEDCLQGLGEVNPNCVLYKVLFETVSNITPFTNVFYPPYMFSDVVDLTEKNSILSEFVDDIQITDEVCVMLEKATRGQHANNFWKEARSFVITASNFGSVVKRSADTAPDLLLKRLRQYASRVDTKPMAYGRKNESKALKSFGQFHIGGC